MPVSRRAADPRSLLPHPLPVQAGADVLHLADDLVVLSHPVGVGAVHFGRRNRTGTITAQPSASQHVLAPRGAGTGAGRRHRRRGVGAVPVPVPPPVLRARGNQLPAVPGLGAVAARGSSRRGGCEHHDSGHRRGIRLLQPLQRHLPAHVRPVRDRAAGGWDRDHDHARTPGSTSDHAKRSRTAAVTAERSSRPVTVACSVRESCKSPVQHDVSGHFSRYSAGTPQGQPARPLPGARAGSRQEDLQTRGFPVRIRRRRSQR